MIRLRQVTRQQFDIQRENLRRGIGLAVASTALALGAAGCGDSNRTSESPGASGEESGTIICGSHTEIDQTDRARQVPDYYIVAAMNRKLRYFPEFASAIGMQSVSNCDQARDFSAKYAKYFAAHPYFDKDLPVDLAHNKPPQHTEPALVPKVFNGTTTGPDPSSADPFPVVQLIHHFGRNARYKNGQLVDPDGVPVDIFCSGTFISKNFILTAAHCFQDVVLTHNTGLDPNSLWITEDEWEVQWPDSTGRVLESGGGMTQHDFPSAVTIVHPSFQGPSIVANAPAEAQADITVPSPYDIGLLFFDPTAADGFLGPDVDKSTWDVQFEDADAIASSWSVTSWGYGPIAENGANNHILNAKSLASDQTLDTPIDDNFGIGVTFRTDVVDPSNDLAICTGDSGGPLVRQASPPSSDTVIVAVNSTIGVSSGSQRCGSRGPNPDAGQRFGDFTYYARTDVAKQFFIDIIGGWASSIPTKSLIDEGSHLQSYMKLHGPSCSTDCDCADTEFCDNPIDSPGSAFSSSASNGGAACSACVDCSCIKGQCLPKPESDGGVGDAGMGNSCGIPTP